MSTNIKSAIFRLNLPLRRRSGSFFITPMTFTNFSLLYVFLTKTFLNVEFVLEKGLKLFFFYFHRNHAANGGRTAVKNYFYVVRTYHINFEQNQFNDITTNIKSAIFRLNPPLGRCSGGFCCTTDSYLISLSLFIMKSYFNVEFVK